ncbi:MAG: fasciclin domain-containing protein [Planctomycetota bacterium]|nr:fasciclin domain-containing protein [Planctomycetota bacterium]
MSFIRKLLSFYHPSERPAETLMTVLQRQGRYKLFLAALRDTGHDQLLYEPGPLTVFAPTDAAFTRHPRLMDLLHDYDHLDGVLLHHFCIGQFDRNSLLGIAKLRPMDGPEIETCAKSPDVKDARILQADLRAWNGIAHGIDRLLIRENHSWLRDAGAAVKADLRAGTLQAAQWIKLSAEKVERALTQSASI